MPLSIGVQETPAVTIRVEFDQSTYGPGDPIGFQIVVEGEPVTVTHDEVFTGTVTLPGQAPQEVSGAAQVVETTTYGPFTADRYDVAQDPQNPARYTATPKEG